MQSNARIKNKFTKVAMITKIIANTIFRPMKMVKRKPIKLLGELKKQIDDKSDHVVKLGMTQNLIIIFHPG